MRRWQLILAIVLFVLALLLPVFGLTDYSMQVLFRIFLFAALGLAWNLVGGYTGQLSLGHAAYFGVGAYSLALFSKQGFSPWLGLVFGMLLAAFSAGIIGGVSFRLRGPYFALSTIAFAEVMRLAAKNLVNLTGGDVGTEVPLLFTNSPVKAFYVAAVLLTALSFWFTVWMSKSRFGYYLMAIREDQDTAMTVGVNTTKYKLYALLISASVTAIGGALYASLFLFIVPDQVLSMEISTEIAIVAMLGGAGTVLGPIVGSVVLEFSGEVFKTYFKEANLLIYGVLIVIVVLFLPEGIVGTLAQKLRGWRKAPAAPFAARARSPLNEEASRLPSEEAAQHSSGKA